MNDIAIADTAGEVVAETNKVNTIPAESNEAYETVGKPLSDSAKMSMRNVNVFYAEKQAIFDVSLDIGTNEVVAMIGTSG